MARHRSCIATAALGLFVASGCLPWGKPSDVRKNTDALLPPPGSQVNGQLIAPKRNSLKTALISRPTKDPAIGEKLWSSADEQCIPPETRRNLEANGLRVGVISGSLPVETEAVMNEPPPNRVDPIHIDLPDGDPSQVNLASAVESTTLLITRDGRTQGKDYTDASGILRFTANQDGQGGIILKLTPELRHGPVSKEFAPAPTSGPYAPQEFMMKSGQKEEQFRDLTTTINVKPGQIVVVGGTRSESGRDIGSFLFSEIDKKNDQAKQKVLLIWATPNGNFSAIDAAKEVLQSSAPAGERR